MVDSSALMLHICARVRGITIQCIPFHLGILITSIAVKCSLLRAARIIEVDLEPDRNPSRVIR